MARFTATIRLRTVMRVLGVLLGIALIPSGILMAFTVDGFRDLSTAIGMVGIGLFFLVFGITDGRRTAFLATT